MQMNTIGLVTYHSAYNFGSVLQAFATQKAVEQLGYGCEIINYRMKSQKEYYSTIRLKSGYRKFLKDISSIPIISARNRRKNKYEVFIKKYLNCSKEVSTYESVSQEWNKYNIIISGSDQIWNKNSNELMNTDWKNMYPYLLKGYSGKKISYASSIASMSESQLNYIKPDLVKFDHISCRESYSANKLSNILNRNIDYVLDPTLLFTKDQWDDFFSENTNNEFEYEKYILFYSLENRKTLEKYLTSINKLSMEIGLNIIAITPLTFINNKYSNIKFINDCGPIDFIRLIKNSAAVITDSYHGTLFSVNYGKRIISICNKNNASDMRKVDILKTLGLSEAISSIDEIQNKIGIDIAYDNIYRAVDEHKNLSFNYLKNAIIN